jgi:hypothetical protein
VEEIHFKQGSTTRMTSPRAYDQLNRLQRVSSSLSAAFAISFDGRHNDANRRKRIRLGDGGAEG